jgi:tyrosinase
VNFTPGQTLPGQPLAPQYDDLYAGTGIPPAPVAPVTLEAVVKGISMAAKFSSTDAPAARLLGVNTARLSIDTAPVTTRVKMSAAPVVLTEALVHTSPGKVFLNLENIRGATPTGLITVYIGLPGGKGMTLVDSVELFGLGKASDAQGKHGGNGMSVALDISKLAQSLRTQSPQALNEMEVRIEQPDSPMKATITVERVSVSAQ